MIWQLSTAANAVIALAYVAIFVLIARGLIRTGQFGRRNPLGTATALIFLTCGLGHAGHVEHLVAGTPQGEALRNALDWHLLPIDTLTAVIAVYYLSLRSSYRRLLDGPSMFEDVARRRLERAVADERRQLAEAQALARVGSCEVQATDGHSTRSAELDRIFAGATADGPRPR